MAVSKRLRYEVLRRDKQTCQYCGARAPQTPLTVDHVVPRTLGGSDQPDNLVAACFDCNAGKSSSRPDDALTHAVSAADHDWQSPSRPYREAVESLYGLLPGFDFDAERARLADDFDESRSDDEDDDGKPREYLWPTDVKAAVQSVEELVELNDWASFIIGLLRKDLDPKTWRRHVEDSIRCHENAGDELEEKTVLRYVVVRALREYINLCSPTAVEP